MCQESTNVWILSQWQVCKLLLYTAMIFPNTSLHLNESVRVLQEEHLIKKKAGRLRLRSKE